MKPITEMTDEELEEEIHRLEAIELKQAPSFPTSRKSTKPPASKPSRKSWKDALLND